VITTLAPGLALGAFVLFSLTVIISQVMHW